MSIVGNFMNQSKEKEEHVKEEIKKEVVEIVEKPNAIESDIVENIESKSILKIDVEKLISFKNHPFKLYNEEKEEEMIESIKLNGIIHKPIVRKLEDGNYEILSGHNRINCAKKCGITEIACDIIDVDDDMAKIIMVESNLVGRENINPMEKAKAIKIKYDTLKKSSFQNKLEKSIRDILIEKEKMSAGNIQRYLKLNDLIIELQNLIDDGTMPLKVGEQLSFMDKKSQEVLFGVMLKDKNTKLNENQAKKLKEISNEEKLNVEKVNEILYKQQEIKENKIIFTEKELEKYFNDIQDISYIKKEILKLLEKHFNEN